MGNEYPKMLYGNGWDDLSDCRLVENAEQEAKARSDGYAELGVIGDAATTQKRGRRKAVEGA